MQDECITNGLCGSSILCARKFKSARVLFPSCLCAANFRRFIGVASAAIFRWGYTRDFKGYIWKREDRNSPKTDYFSGGFLTTTDPSEALLMAAVSGKGSSLGTPGRFLELHPRDGHGPRSTTAVARGDGFADDRNLKKIGRWHMLPRCFCYLKISEVKLVSF